MKRTKKILAIVLAIFTLMSVMAIPSFAATTLPTVEFIEFTDDNAISLKQLDNYFTSVEEEFEDMYDQWGGMLDDFDDFLTLEDASFNLDYAGIDYTLTVTLSNGEELNLFSSNWFLCDDPDNGYSVYANVYVTYADYCDAKENGYDAVVLTVETVVTDENYENSTENTFRYEKDLIDYYVRSITPVSGIPTYVYENCDYVHNIIGGKFLVTYADGSKETLIVDWDSYGYTLGDKEFSVELDGDELKCQFIDGVFEKTVIPIAAPFNKVEITECDYNSLTDIVEIKYDITLNNGTVESFEAVVDVYGFDYGYEIIDSYLGFDIYFLAEEYVIDENNKINADNYLFTVEIGYEDDAVSDTYEIENPMGFFVKIRVWFEIIIETIREFFYNIFGYEYY